MQVLHGVEALSLDDAPSVVTVGFFDGVHLGHQQIIRQTINDARQSGGKVLAAGNAPPPLLPLREDLKSRLAWGLVYHVKPLTDDERASYLRAEAGRRGMRVPDEVISYLLTHVRRDLPTLVAILDEVDRASLEKKHPITLPLVKTALKEMEA